MPIPGNYLSETTSTIDPNASGWVAHLNATTARGTGGTVTTGCLLMKSVAAGEMQCRTVSSYAVTPGTEYAAFADAFGSTVPERIGIRWLDSSSAQISITWALTTSAASGSWHRISVADVAPEDAVYAQVMFSSTPAAGNVNNFFDHIYLGLPQRTTGNLLSFDAESSERASNWPFVVGSNCSIARTVPSVGWSSSIYSAGGHVATMTVTGAGDAEFVSTERPMVTPGQDYLALAYLNPPTSAADAWLELRFYDAAESLILASRSVLDAPGTGWYMQRLGQVAPAGAVTATLAFGLVGATAGQVLRVDRACILVAPQYREGDIVPYEDTVFEQGVGAWTVTSGVAALSRHGPWNDDAAEAFYSMAITSATATTSVVRSGRYQLGTVADGLDWTMEVYTKVAAGGWTLTRGIRWYDEADVDLGVTSAGPGAVPTPDWWVLSVSDAALAGATQAEIELTLTATSGASELRIDRVSLWQTLPLDEVVVHDETASVTVTVRELPTADPFTLWRVSADGDRTLVRGTDGLLDRVGITDTVLVVEDYEAPLGTPFHYYSESKDASGAVAASRTTSTVSITHVDANEVWLKDPSNPQRNLQLVVKQAPDWQRPISQAEHRVRGRRNSVVLSDVRGGLEGDLVIWTRSDDERAALHWILDSGSVLLWQASPGNGVDDMYVTVDTVTEARVTSYAPEQWREWTLPLKQADMPVAVGVTGSAGRTWQDILTEHATWRDVLDKYATWEDVMLNRPIGG